jgi:hypothetical protein
MLSIKLWVLAEKMMNQLAMQKQSITANNKSADEVGVDLSGLLDSVDQTAHIRGARDCCLFVVCLLFVCLF